MRACFVVREAAWSGATRAFADAATLLAGHGYETCFVGPAGSEAERCLVDAGHDVVGVTAGGGWLRAGARLRQVVTRRLSEVLFVHDDREHLSAALAVRLAGRGAVVRRTPPGERLSLGREGRRAMRLAATGFVFASVDDVNGITPPRGALAACVAPPGVRAAPPRSNAGVAAAGAAGASGTAGAGVAVQRLAIFCGAGRRHEAFGALRALALLAPRLPRLRVTIFWPAADLDAARLESAALGVAGRIDWRDHDMPRAEVLAQADLAWVIATADEAVFAMLDALAHGVPVLADRSPLAGRFVGDGVSGVLRHDADEAAWASVVAATLGHAARLERMRDEARRAAARWPLDGGADGWVQVTEAARDRTRWRT